MLHVAYKPNILKCSYVYATYNYILPVATMVIIWLASISSYNAAGSYYT